MLRPGPVKKLSTHSTSLPSAKRRSVKCEPMNSAPPVINMRVKMHLGLAPQSSEHPSAQLSP